MRKGIQAVLLAVGAFSMTLSSNTLAQEEAGFYLGGNFGYTRIDSGSLADDTRNDLLAAGVSSASASVDESDRGFKLLAGYQFHRNIAVEAYYANLGTYDVSFGTTGPTTSGSGEVEVTGFGIDVLGILPFNRWVSGFARVGLFRWESETNASFSAPGFGTRNISGDDDGTEVKFGIGVEWALARNVRLRGELEYYNFEEKLTMLSAGVVFRF